METIGIEVVLILAGILLNGFFAGAEFALVSSRISRLAQLRVSADSAAAVAMRLKESPDAFLATIQIGITLVGTLASAVGGATAVEALTPVFSDAGLGQASQPAALGVVIVVITYVSLVLGELVPKSIALRDPERAAILVARPILWLSRVSGGVVRVLTVSTTAVVRLAGLRTTAQSPFISEEEVRYLVREGAAKGIFEKAEEELVHNVFEFADTTVRDIMVPRPSIRGLDVATPADEVGPRAAAIGHSRIPVYRDDIINPVGMLGLKDLLRALAEGRRPALPELIRPPLFVPESSKISALLREFQRNRQSLALVVDEYGTVVGLITIEDIVEEIVGAIDEEGQADAAGAITRLADGALLVDGLASVDELRAAGVAVEDSRDYTTAAGVLIARLGAIPSKGTSVVKAGHRWTVLDTEGPRIRKIRIEPVQGG